MINVLKLKTIPRDGRRRMNNVEEWNTCTSFPNEITNVDIEFHLTLTSITSDIELTLLEVELNSY